MHPLDAYPLEGFDVVASAEWVVRRPVDETWTVLAVEGGDAWPAPTDLEHRVVETYGPGEHRCSSVGVLAGRPVCVRGLRRLLPGREVLELHRALGLEVLIRTTFEPWRLARTRMGVTIATRTVAAVVAGCPVPPWQDVLARRHEEARTASVRRQAAQ